MTIILERREYNDRMTWSADKKKNDFEFLLTHGNSSIKKLPFLLAKVNVVLS
jgi:hypothetical protein